MFKGNFVLEQFRQQKIIEKFGRMIILCPPPYHMQNGYRCDDGNYSQGWRWGGGGGQNFGQYKNNFKEEESSFMPIVCRYSCPLLLLHLRVVVVVMMERDASPVSLLQLFPWMGVVVCCVFVEEAVTGEDERIRWCLVAMAQQSSQRLRKAEGEPQVVLLEAIVKAIAGKTFVRTGGVVVLWMAVHSKMVFAKVVVFRGWFQRQCGGEVLNKTSWVQDSGVRASV